MPFTFLRKRVRRRGRGQSLVEFALVLPVLLILLLAAIDFGRVYLGWINLNQMARIAANFASTNPDADFADPSGTYQTLILQDARATNCDLLPPGPTNTAPAPAFASGTALGAPVTVALTCRFSVITPVISSILGNAINVTATSTFPVRSGAVSGIPVGGGTSNVPIAEFSGSPTSGLTPLTVTFTDLSSNAPLTWFWSFGDGGTSSTPGSVTHTYASAGTYAVALTVSNPAGQDTETKSGYVVVTDTPVGLAADFSGTPTSGNNPLTVVFTDASTGSPTSWTWAFGDGGTSNAQNPTHTYQNAGTYDVALTVSDGTSSNTLTKSAYISVAVPTCVVPNVSDGNTRKNTATNTLQGQGYTVNQVGGPGNWFVRVQSPQGGLVVPCGSTVSIFE